MYMPIITDIETAAGAGVANTNTWRFEEKYGTIPMHIFSNEGNLVETVELDRHSILEEIEDLGGDYYRIYGLHDGHKFCVEGVLDPWTPLVIL